MRQRPLTLLLLVAPLLLAAACGSSDRADAPAASAPPPTSAPAATPAPASTPEPATVSAATLPAPADEAGSVVSSAPLTTTLPGRATAVRYRSTDTDGRPVEVTGTVVVPQAPPPGPLKLITYAVGTQGMADRCAPSRQFAAGTEYEAPFVSALLQRGYAVAITDYEGLGTPGDHTYVNRAAEGHAVLDVARAARRLDVGLPADGPVAVMGYSQGGGASAAAAELAPTYAPDVALVGAYAGAVPADLAAVGTFLDGSPSAGLLGYSLNGFGAAYPELRIPDQLNQRGKDFLTTTDRQCVSETRFPGLRSATLTRDGGTFTELLAGEPYRDRVEQQRLGTVAPRTPVLVGHSTADDVVPYEQDAAMVRSWCAQGARVQFLPTPVPTHTAAAVALFPQALAYLDARFAGTPAPSTCS